MNYWQRISYQGWENCYCYENASLKVIVTTDVGPRVIHISTAGGENQFFVNEDASGSSGSVEFVMYGGHRFWTSPESKERTYVPDNYPVKATIEGNIFSVTAPIEPIGVQKTLTLEPATNSNGIKVSHVLANKGNQPIEIAPWGLSVMRSGGTAIIPLPPKALHTELLTPTLSFTHWGYTDITDPRWGWGEEFLFLRQDEHVERPQKIGIHSGRDWAAYLNNGNLFIKIAKYLPNVVYPDFGSHFEFFTNDYMLEIESLGALGVLKPGDQAIHSEYWFVYDNVKTVISEEGVTKNIFPLVKKSLLLGK
jgi:hypothetical protein